MACPATNGAVFSQHDGPAEHEFTSLGRRTHLGVECTLCRIQSYSQKQTSKPRVATGQPVEVWLIPVECCPLQHKVLKTAVESLYADLCRIDRLSHWYYRAQFLLDVARDFFQCLPDLKPELTIPDASRILQPIMQRFLTEHHQFALDARQWTNDPSQDSLTQAADHIRDVYRAKFVEPRMHFAHKIRRQFRECADVQQLFRGADLSFDWTDLAFQDLLATTVLDDTITSEYAPPPDFQKTFWTDVSRALESSGHEVHDRILERVSSFLMQSAFSSGGRGHLSDSHKTFEYANSETVTVRMNLDVGNNVGTTLWPSGFVMAELALDQPDLFRNRRCLELGSGVGLTSSVVHRLSPLHFTCTDYDHETLDLLRQNLAINDATHVLVQELDWFEATDSDAARFDAEVIFAADVTYAPEIVPPLLAFVARCLRHRLDSRCFLANMKRVPETWQLFLDTIASNGLEFREIHVADIPQLFRFAKRDQVVLFEVSLKAA